jgi:2'-5' RNA ligase
MERTGEDKKLRLFTALELPEAWRQALSRLQAGLESAASGQVKWVKPDLMHLTLIFLGYQEPRAVTALSSALEAAASQPRPFRLYLSQVGFFGQPHRLRVLWVGLAEAPADLRRLHQALTAELSARDIAFDLKPLVPHVTLGRARDSLERAASLRLHAALLRSRLPADLQAEVSRFVLMQSHLSPAGPEYRVVAEFPLGGTHG